MLPYMSDQISELGFYKLLLKTANSNIELKVIDIILLQKREPTIWLFTDTKGHLKANSLTNMSIDNLVKAIICNINSVAGKIEHQDIIAVSYTHLTLPTICSV
eukprot:TRINITY_DN16246_c0_g3_i2.p1 TRINITY_DN16246_c0_g3~~TRINITY_DN16246_c0_g3_i2.p1  ORF type:complete len:103 (-),score=16.41 TRINITY_DN16246_c0_g3_i2:41-349(-)